MKTRAILWLTAAAMVPGGALMAFHLGPGVIVNVAAAMAACLLCEAVCLALRGEAQSRLGDGSAALTGLILGLCLPPLLPLWMIAVGAVFAIVFAKHMYGGLGQNVFNPAMAGFAAMIVSFPLAMSTWAAQGESPDLAMLVAIKLGTVAADGFTGATTLDVFRFADGITMAEFWRANAAGHAAWLHINVAFLCGGLAITVLGITRWQASAAMLATIVVLALAFQDSGSSTGLGSPYLHLFSGATMMAAFFVVTDPVTSPDAVRGQVLFGAGVGFLVFLIRSVGAYPDGVAFAVLLMNAASPLIDHVAFRMQAARA